VALIISTIDDARLEDCSSGESYDPEVLVAQDQDCESIRAVVLHSKPDSSPSPHDTQRPHEPTQ
jgi:hypothetical protein